MNFVFTVSHIMKASEVSRLCKEIRENRIFLAALELELKKHLFEKKQKAAS
jgi:hypothetical protein